MANKEVIYIDTEDDITSVIEKTTGSKAGIIALVLPKRYSTLKSSVNMKLLKKTADGKKKKIVLITNDDALLPLAGNAGIHVSESLKTRPTIPKFNKPQKDKSPIVADGDPDLDMSASIGELSGDKKSKKAAKKEHSGGTSASDKSDKIKKIKNSSKIKVPNFNRFRLRLVLIFLGVVGLVVGWYFAFNVIPKAKITIQAQTSRVSTEVQFNVNPTRESNSIANNKLIGEVQEISKTVTERFEATGEKDKGKKASGIVTVENCYTSEEVDVPAGTVFTDTTTGFTFSSNEAATVPAAFFAGGCSSPGTVDIAVTAVEGGDAKNVSPRGYTVGGLPSQITGFGGAMSGGTTEVVTVVSEDDINKAKSLLLEKTDDNIRSELAALFTADTVIIDETFEVSNTTPLTSDKADSEVNEASVSAQFTYSIIGIPNDKMVKILEQKQSTLVDISAQSILDSGVSEVELTVIEKRETGAYVVEATTTGFVGPEINPDELAGEVAGKRFSEAVDLIKARPGVKDVDIELSPFWVFSLPAAEKTTITVEVSDDTLQ